MNWQDVKSYDDLKIATIAFIKGDLKETPYHAGSLEDEDLVPLLVRLNNFGLVTYDGQQGLVLFHNDKPKQWQRSYVSFIVPYSERWRKVENNLATDPRVDVVIYDSRKGREKQNLVVYAVRNNNLTKYIDETGNMVYYTNIPKPIWGQDEEIADEQWHHAPNIKNMLKRGHYRYVTLALREYGVPGIENVLLGYL